MRKTTDPIVRFHNNYTVAQNGCWEWDKYTNKGYARFNDGTKIVDAHRWYFKIHNKINLGSRQHLDHLCRNRRCVNPDHLEVVDNYTNWSRGESITLKKKLQTHCIHGHELIGKNLYMNGNKRRCNECHKLKARVYRAVKRANS